MGKVQGQIKEVCRLLEPESIVYCLVVLTIEASTCQSRFPCLDMVKLQDMVLILELGLTLKHLDIHAFPNRTYAIRLVIRTNAIERERGTLLLLAKLDKSRPFHPIALKCQLKDCWGWVSLVHSFHH